MKAGTIDHTAAAIAEIQQDYQSSRVKNPARRYQKIGRNDPCPCGSGTKFKKCCLDKVKDQRDRQREQARERARW